MKTFHSFRIASAATLIALTLPFAASLAPAQSPDSENINHLLAEAKSDAVQAQEHANTLRMYTKSNLSIHSHSNELNAMRAHVNDFGRVVQNLNDARAEGSPWQQEAIDRIDPLLRDIGQQLTDTINHLNKANGRVNTPEYRDYTEANYDLTTRTAQIISDFVDYGRAKDKMNRLERKLEVAGAGSE